MKYHYVYIIRFSVIFIIKNQCCLKLPDMTQKSATPTGRSAICKDCKAIPKAIARRLVNTMKCVDGNILPRQY